MKRRSSRASPAKRLTTNRTAARAWLILGAILLVAGALRAAYLGELVHKPDFDSLLGDAKYNDYWARGIATGEWLPPVAPGDSSVTEDGREEQADSRIQSTAYFRPPGYPYFLAAIYRVFGTGHLAPRVIQMFLGLVSCVLVFLLGRALFGSVTGLVGAGFTGIYWAFVYFEGELQPPALLVFLVLAWMHVLMRWAVRPRYHWALLGGLLLGLLALVRPNVLLLIPVVIGWSWWVLRRTNAVQQPEPDEDRSLPSPSPYLRFSLMSLTLLAGLIVTIAPVTIRNWVVAHDFVLISTNGGVNLYIGNNPQTSLVTPRIPDIEQLAGRSRWSLFAYPEIVRGVESITQRTMKHSEVSRYFAGRALEFMRDNPVRALGYAARRALLLWGPREVSNNKVLHFEWKNSAILRWLPGFPLALSGFLMGLVAYWLERNAARRRQPPPEPDAAPRVEMAVLILLFVVVYSASFVPFLAAGRFRVPLIAFLLIFGAYALVWLARRVAARKLGRAAAWAVAWLALYGLANIPLVHYEPDLGRWHLDRATAYAFGGKPDEAIGEYRSAIEANPEFPRTYAELGSLLVRKGEFDEAIANYRKAIELDPSFAQLRRTLAELLLYLDRVEEAVAEYRAALELSPDNAQAWYSLGRALQRSGADDEALEAYRRAVEVDPGFAEARVNMGILLQAKGRVQEAEQAFRRAIESNPNLFEAHYNLASALASQGRIDEALRSLSTALHIRPGHEAARQAWKALKEQQQSRPPPGSAPATDRPTTPTP